MRGNELCVGQLGMPGEWSLVELGVQGVPCSLGLPWLVFGVGRELSDSWNGPVVREFVLDGLVLCSLDLGFPVEGFQIVR